MKEKQTITLHTVAVLCLVAIALGFVIGVMAHAKLYPCVIVPTISVQRDTVRRTDTIRGVIRPPVIKTVIQRDTLILPSRPDTTRIDTIKTDTSK